MLDTLIKISFAATLLALGWLLGKLLTRPLLLPVRLLVNALLGITALIFMELLGLSLGINALTAAVSALLGLPGVALIVAVRWLL